MTTPDPNTPVEPVSAAPQQVASDPALATPAQPNAAPAANPNEDWKARFTGAMQKIQELTLTNQSLTGQLAEKSSIVEQLNAQLSGKDAEKTVAVGERDKQLEAALQAKQSLESQLAQANALVMKVNAAREIGRPDLIMIADTIPNFTDPELLKKSLGDIAAWSDSQVKAREAQLLAGETPGTSAVQVAPKGPGSKSSWEERINSLPIGSPERKKALDDYGDWLQDPANRQL